MLLAYRCHDSDLRMHQVADFFDIARLLGPHFNNKYFVIGLEIFSDGADHTHRGVETARSHHHIIFLRKNAVEIVFGACFSIASGHTDDFQIRHSA